MSDVAPLPLNNLSLVLLIPTIPKNDNDIQIANILCQLEDEHKADAVFIDAGYGTGIASTGHPFMVSHVGWIKRGARIHQFELKH